MGHNIYDCHPDRPKGTIGRYALYEKTKEILHTLDDQLTNDHGFDGTESVWGDIYSIWQAFGILDGSCSLPESPTFNLDTYQIDARYLAEANVKESGDTAEVCRLVRSAGKRLLNWSYKYWVKTK